MYLPTYAHVSILADLHADVAKYEAVLREAADEGMEMVEEEVHPKTMYPKPETLKLKSKIRNPRTPETREIQILSPKRQEDAGHESEEDAGHESEALPMMRGLIGEVREMEEAMQQAREELGQMPNLSKS